MFSDHNNIIVVDNEVSSLDRIAKVFNQHGIGCRLILTDGFNMPFSEPLIGVKIAFVDINYNSTGDDKAMFATLYNVLKNIISKDNSPYSLIFWTTNGDKIDEFKKYVNRDWQSQELAKPISINLLDKNKFDDTSLPDAIERIYSDPLVKCLFSFTEQLRDASDNCIKEILSRIPMDEIWGESVTFSKNVKDLFSKIAIETLGITNGKLYPDRAIKESLIPVFNYSLCTNGNKCWEDYLELYNNDNANLKKINIDYIIPFLNSIYHIDKKDISDLTERGIVRLFNNDEDCFINKIGYEKEKS